MMGLPKSARTHRLLIGGFVAFAAPLLSQCGRGDDAEPNVKETKADVAAPTLAAQPQPLGRADLLQAFDAAASRFAAGEAPSEPDRLVGRSFELKLPFGCGGLQTLTEDAQPELEGLATAAWGRDRRSIVLSLTPADWSEASLLYNGRGGSTWEAAEGFWLARPWLRTEACPAVKTDPLQSDAGPRSTQTAGLAAVFESGGSRVGRRDGRAYRFVIRGEGDAPPLPSPSGYRVKLSGRVVGFPDRRAVRCTSSGVDQRPVCVTAIKLDEVAFETPDGAVLSRWRSG